MNQKLKRINAIRNDRGQVRFDDACAVALELEFTAQGGKGSHRVFARAGEAIGLTFQNRNGYIPNYQAQQLRDMIKLYWSES